MACLLGWLAPDFAIRLKPLSTIFLDMIKSLIAPLLFATLVVGIAGHGDDMKKVGRLAFRSIVYFEVVTTLALAVGLIAVNLVRPGAGIGLDATAEVSATVTEASQRQVTFTGVLEHIVPSSFIDAAAKNEVLQVVFWSIIFAVALARTPIGPKKIILSFTESLGEVMFKFVGIVMAFAPFGIGAAIAVTVGQSGIGVLQKPRDPGADVVRRADRVRAARAAAGCADLPNPDRDVLADRARAMADRVLHGIVGGSASAARCRRWKRSAYRVASSRS